MSEGVANYNVANFFVRGWRRQSDAGASLGRDIMQLILKHYVGYFGLKNLPAHHHHRHHHGYPEDILLHRNLLADPRLRSHREARTICRRDAASRVSRCAWNRRRKPRLYQTTDGQSRVYSPEATVGGCKLERREIVATIIPERNCIVATSLLSNACGVDDSTSKTPRVRRKWRSGATRMERTPSRRQLAQSTRAFDSASWQSSTSPVRTHSAESPLSVCRRTPISGAVRPVRARQIISLPRRNAMAAPVAPVKVCAFSAMMLMPGSRSISPVSIGAGCAEACP